jgi:hypothetical protein
MATILCVFASYISFSESMLSALDSANVVLETNRISMKTRLKKKGHNPRPAKPSTEPSYPNLKANSHATPPLPRQ